MKAAVFGTWSEFVFIGEIGIQAPILERCDTAGMYVLKISSETACRRVFLYVVVLDVDVSICRSALCSAANVRAAVVGVCRNGHSGILGKVFADLDARAVDLLVEVVKVSLTRELRASDELILN